MALSKRKHYQVSKLDVSELGIMRFRSGARGWGKCQSYVDRKVLQKEHCVEEPRAVSREKIVASKELKQGSSN